MEPDTSTYWTRPIVRSGVGRLGRGAVGAMPLVLADAALRSADVDDVHAHGLVRKITR